MALPNTTTLSAAVAINDTTVLLASITNVTAGNFFRIDQEVFKILSVPAAATTPVPVLRGQEGTAQVAHLTSAQILLGASPSNLVAGDWPQAAAGAASPTSQPAVKIRTVKNYAAAGAITLPTPGQDAVAIIDATVALAMTLAAPSVLNDGDILTVIGNGKAAHTLALPAGVGLGAGGSGVDVGTFAAGAQQCVVLMAANGVWVPYGSFMGGTSLANVTVTWA